MIELKNMFTLVRVGLAASVSILAVYNTFQLLRNKSDTESGRSLGNHHQNAEVESTEEAQALTYDKRCSVNKKYNANFLSGDLFLNRLTVVKSVDNSKFVVQKLKPIKEDEQAARFILRNGHSNDPSNERPIQPVNRLPVVKRVDNSLCSGHRLIFQKLKTITEEEEQAKFILRNGQSNDPSTERPLQSANMLPVVKTVDNSLCSGHKMIFQKLNTSKEEEEQARFILRNGHSNERLTQPAKINNIKLAEVHTRSSWVAKAPPKPSPFSNCTPVKVPPPSGKPTPPHPPPPPPPPPRGMLNKKGTTSGKLQRAPELVEFYHFLMNRKAKKEAATPTSATTQSNIIAEIKYRSPFFLSVKADVETQGDFIQSLATEVRAAEYTKVEDIVAFVMWLDEELAKLVDERAVLKHFDWPESKVDALREAAFEYLDLKKLETKITSFVDDRKLSCDAALKKLYSLLEKVEKIVYALLSRRDMAIARYKEFGIPYDWLLDSGVVSKIKLASVKLAQDHMKRVASELDNTMNVREKEPMREFILLQCIRFALRVYQFAGGLDLESMRAFKELRDRACAHAERTDSLSLIK